MSPTTATDIYSLGVVLYELLTGRPPFQGETRKAIENEVTDTAPTRPSDVVLKFADTLPSARRVSRQLKGDIDTVVLMALRKEPERRYASAEQFGEDIRRHLKGQPVIAQADTVGYRARKFIGRNAAAVSAAAVLALVLVCSTVLSMALYNRAEKARREATRERAAAVSTSDFLQNLLATADPSSVETSPDITVRSALDWAAKRLETELNDQPSVAAGLHATIGRAYMNLGVLGEARAHMDQALVLFEAGTPRDLEHITQTRIIIGQLLEKGGAYDEAEQELLGALAMTDDADFDPSIRAENELSLSRVYSGMMKTEEAEVFARRAVVTADRIEDQQSLLHAQALNEVGVALYRAGKYEEAAPTLEQAVEVASRTVGPKHVLRGEGYNNLAVVFSTVGRAEEAIESYRRCLEIYEAVYPANHPEFATTHLNMADALNKSEHFEEAIQLYTQSIREFGATHGESFVMIGLAENGIGRALRELDDLQGAREHYRAALDIMIPALGNDHAWLATIRNNLARVLLDLGEDREAEVMALAALAQMRANLPAGHHHISRPLGLLAAIHAGRGEYDAALPFAREAVEICQAALDPADADRIQLEALLTRCLDASSDGTSAH